MTEITNIEKPGFSATPNFKWSDYIKHRPVYPQSFYERVYKYHEIHLNEWSRAHDVGSGPGIASSELATRFKKVIVSDPNDGYVNVASDRLIGEFKFPQSQFQFLQEGAEKSSVEDNSIDLVMICQAIHWTDIPVAMKEFARQLKGGGTLSINYYARPSFPDNAAAQKVWDEIWDVWAERLGDAGAIPLRALHTSDSGLNTVPFPLEEWESGARRIFINTRGREESMVMSMKHRHFAPNRVGETDVREFVENDLDWIEEKDIDWLKGMFASVLPSVPEDDIKDLWTELENQIGGKAKKLKVVHPAIQLLATRR